MLADEIPGYMDRHQSDPASRAWLRSICPPDTDLHSVRRKLVVDLHYVKHGNLSMDVRIFLLHVLPDARHSPDSYRPAYGGSTVEPQLREGGRQPLAGLGLGDGCTIRGHQLNRRLDSAPYDDCQLISATPLNAFTVDVEDYFQVSTLKARSLAALGAIFQVALWPTPNESCELLDRHEIRATFYVLGWIAQHHPELVRTIHRAGHEIGSHSYWHRLIYTLTPEEFRADLLQSRAVLEDLIAAPVTSYRAPSFSITQKSLWALDILAEEGFEVDSSIYPVYHDRYGIPNAESRLHRLRTPSGDLWEFPPAVARIG